MVELAKTLINKQTKEKYIRKIGSGINGLHTF